MKYALVTSSTRGIGKAIGLRFLSEGYHVIFNYSRSIEDAETLKRELEKSNITNFTFVQQDLSIHENIDLFCEKVKCITNCLDIVVFNTGITDRTAFEDIKWEDWNRVINTNLNIPVFILKNLLSHIRQGGGIVFIGSILGNVQHARSLSYGVTKSAVHALVKNLVKYLAPKGIRVNGVAPGFIDTDWQKEKPLWLREKIEFKIALNRFGKSEEVAEIVWSVCNSSYVNGQIIAIDGGYNFE